jgi:hypothetical protein
MREKLDSSSYPVTKTGSQKAAVIRGWGHYLQYTLADMESSTAVMLDTAMHETSRWKWNFLYYWDFGKTSEIKLFLEFQQWKFPVKEMQIYANIGRQFRTIQQIRGVSAVQPISEGNVYFKLPKTACLTFNNNTIEFSDTQPSVLLPRPAALSQLQLSPHLVGVFALPSCLTSNYTAGQRTALVNLT